VTHDPWAFDAPILATVEPPPYPEPDEHRPSEVDRLYQLARRILFRIQRPSEEYRNRDWVVEAWDVPGRPPWVRVYTLIEKGGNVIVGRWRGVHAADTLLVSGMLREAAVRIANVEWLQRGRIL
jgi:hypothetical protein